MRNNGMKKLAIVTLGCQMNKHDSEWIAGLLQDEYELTEHKEEADFLLVNSCTVRDKAEQKFFSLLGRLRPLKAAKRDMVIGVAGCVAQDQGVAVIKREPLVDLVVGSRAIENVPALLERFLETGEPQVDTSFTDRFDELTMIRASSHSAWVSIMQGCDNYCSYCIVPSVRGPERSRPARFIIDEIRLLAEKGYKEITLLGQNVNSYGTGLDTEIDFPSLLEKVNSIDGIERIRFVTSHPKDLSNRLIDAMADLPKVCPALHLPLQSGSDNILDKMNRGYTSAHYFERVERLREKVADLSLTSDMIVGFPGETDEDFDETYEALERVSFTNIFLFKYSPRKGTAAVDLAGIVDPSVVTSRFDRLMGLQKKITQGAYNSWVGREVQIVGEGPSKKDSSRQTGRSPQNLIVHFESDIDYTGKTIHVIIMKVGKYSLDGLLVKQNVQSKDVLGE